MKRKLDQIACIVSWSIILLMMLLIAACSNLVIEYPSVCVNDNTECQRNLNAETLSNIGEQEAAIELLKTDPSMSSVLNGPAGYSK